MRKIIREESKAVINCREFREEGLISGEMYIFPESIFFINFACFKSRTIMNGGEKTQTKQ